MSKQKNANSLADFINSLEKAFSKGNVEVNVEENTFKPKKTGKKLLADLEKEKKKIHKKVMLLHEFIKSPAFDEVSCVSQGLLMSQEAAMAAYANIVQVRIVLQSEEMDKTDSEDETEPTCEDCEDE